MWKYHLLAIFTVVIWGSTFISTKILIQAGLTPSQIFFFRFLLAYFGLVVIQLCQRRRIQWRCATWREEVMMILCALTGGSIFFYAQNTAMVYAEASVVSFLVCLAPLTTAVFGLFGKTQNKPSKMLWLGAGIALLGVYFIASGNEHSDGIGNNRLVGIGLSFVAALLWAIYQHLCKPLGDKYNPLMLTRKVLGYGTITILPIVFSEGAIPWHRLVEPQVFGHLLVLGLLASLACFWAWSVVIQRMGSVASAGYLYAPPFVACLLANLFLGEVLTNLMMLGGILILVGVFLSFEPQKMKAK